MAPSLRPSLRQSRLSPHPSSTFFGCLGKTFRLHTDTLAIGGIQPDKFECQGRKTANFSASIGFCYTTFDAGAMFCNDRAVDDERLIEGGTEAVARMDSICRKTVVDSDVRSVPAGIVTVFGTRGGGAGVESTAREESGGGGIDKVVCGGPPTCAVCRGGRLGR